MHQSLDFCKYASLPLKIVFTDSLNRNDFGRHLFNLPDNIFEFVKFTQSQCIYYKIYSVSFGGVKTIK